MKTAQSNSNKIDPAWGDDHVFPRNPYPDVSFLYRRTNELTLGKVAVNKGESVLDIGCGRASEMVMLAQEGGRCIGLEPSTTMLSLARQNITPEGIDACLIQGSAEHLPFRDDSFDKVICKGAIDHFPQPALAIEEMARILKPRGEAIIAITNFESLGFRLGRLLFKIIKLLQKEKTEYESVLLIPADHTLKFDYGVIKRIVKPCFIIEESVGTSLLFGVPYWGWLLAKLPHWLSLTTLGILDKLAHHLPSLSNVIILRCSPKQ